MLRCRATPLQMYPLPSTRAVVFRREREAGRFPASRRVASPGRRESKEGSNAEETRAAGTLVGRTVRRNWPGGERRGLAATQNRPKVRGMAASDAYTYVYFTVLGSSLLDSTETLCSRPVPTRPDPSRGSIEPSCDAIDAFASISDRPRRHATPRCRRSRFYLYRFRALRPRQPRESASGFQSSLETSRCTFKGSAICEPARVNTNLLSGSTCARTTSPLSRTTERNNGSRVSTVAFFGYRAFIGHMPRRN